ncbi:hypothetical protein EV177_010527, partial [Coemansia sp. RSA 1804]
SEQESHLKAAAKPAAKAPTDKAEAESNGSVELPVVSPPPRKASTGAHYAHATMRPSPLRTGDSAASLLSSADGNETPSPLSAATPTMQPSSSHEFKPAVSKAAAVDGGGGGDGKPDYAYITLKCILQLSLIQTIGELFGIDIETGVVSASMLKAKDDVYRHLPAHHLFVLLDCLDQSRVFA